jgi:hypothetical protein
MVVSLRVLYFEQGKEPYISLERAAYLFNIEFEENGFPEQGIHANDILPLLEQGGWNIKIDQPEDEVSNIKVILTQEIIEEINI